MCCATRIMYCKCSQCTDILVIGLRDHLNFGTIITQGVTEHPYFGTILTQGVTEHLILEQKLLRE
jgi:hypothetical protein